jgi:hypothetical protein
MQADAKQVQEAGSQGEQYFRGQTEESLSLHNGVEKRGWAGRGAWVVNTQTQSQEQAKS